MPFILGTNSIKDTGYNVDNSLRFNSGSDDTLTRTVSSASNRRTFTYSGWIKKTILGTGIGLFGQGDYSSSTGSDHFNIRFEGDDNIRIEPSGFDVKTNRLFRDPSAWYHIVLAVDTTQGTASNRVKLYVNGVQETSLATATYPDENEDTQVNTAGDTGTVYLGDVFNATGKFNGYMAEVCFIDGLQLAPTSFGEFDEDSSIWKPIKVSGLTFGTNGYYLDFEDSSALGNDAAGSNNYSLTSIAATDQGLDTCTNNFPVINALNFGSAGLTFADANTSIIANSGDGWRTTYGTIAVSTGKWYWEQKILDASGTSHYIGITDIDVAKNIATNEFENGGVSAYAYRSSDGKKVTSVSGSTALTSYGTGFTTNNIVGIAMDLDNSKIYFSLNGTWQNSGNPESGATGTGAAFTITSGKLYTPATATYNTSNEYAYNFGSPYFAISSGNSDADGFGNFEYTVPDGYFTICTKNLAEYG